MKYSEEWGTGKVPDYEHPLDKNRRLPRFGGSGAVLCGTNTFCLKVVGLLRVGKRRNIQVDTLFSVPEDDYNDLFWEEAKSASVYASTARNIPGCVTCPVPSHYWIHEDEPLFKNFKQTKLSSERPRQLADFGSLFDITTEQWLENGIDPEEYWFVPSELLREIYEKKTKCNLLLTYPILSGDLSLEKCEFDEKDAGKIRQLIYQILSAVLKLYRKGLAHGDIKPANIMRRDMWLRRLPNQKKLRERTYFLTDVGSVHSAELPSKSGTEAFFFKEVYDEWLEKASCETLIGEGGFKPRQNFSEKDLKSLLCRTLMDGYALAITIYVLASGELPKGRPNQALINETWHDDVVNRAFSTLFDVAEITIGKMQHIVGELKNEFPDQDELPLYIQTWGRESEFNFITKKWAGEKNKKLKVEYGYLAEQLNFNGKFNPLLRVNRKSRRSLLPYWAVANPVIESYSNGNTFMHSIYYAPDDAVSGDRTVGFDNYTPYSLEYLLDNDQLTDEIVDELLEFGRRLDEDTKNNYALPYPQDIVKSDEKWIILPFFLKEFFGGEGFSLEEYFKMLCGRENDLTAQNWLDMILFDCNVGILFELLPADMAEKVAELIAVSGDQIWTTQSIRKLDKLRKTSKFVKYEACFDWVFFRKKGFLPRGR